jgi:putative membrane protein
MLDMMGDGNHPGLWLLFGTIWMIVFWGVIIAIVIWGVNQITRGGRRSEGDPLEIARRRYASGEITKEQFDQLRHDLGS